MVERVDKNHQAHHQTTNTHLTPLHIAAYFGKLPLCIQLRQQGAFPHFTTTPRGNTPLHTAINRGFLDVARYLIDHPSTTRNPFTKKISSNSRRNTQGTTPIRLAALKAVREPAWWEIVDKLILAGTLLNPSDLQDIQLPDGTRRHALETIQARLANAEANEATCLVM